MSASESRNQASGDTDEAEPGVAIMLQVWSSSTAGLKRTESC